MPVTQPPLDLVSREALDHNRLFHYCYYLLVCFGKLPQVRKCESGNETSIACLWFTCAACNTGHNTYILWLYAQMESNEKTPLRGPMHDFVSLQANPSDEVTRNDILITADSASTEMEGFANARVSLLL